jgi:hypothetical protein
MEKDLFAWADLAMDIVQGVALAAILCSCSICVGAFWLCSAC